MITLKLKDYPELKELLKLLNYKKQKVFISQFSKQGIRINSYWDGGSKTYYHLVDLITKRLIPLPSGTHPYFDVAGRGYSNQDLEAIEIDEVGNITLKYLPQNIALISSGIFCGKPATAHIYFNEVNMPKLLPQYARMTA